MGFGRVALNSACSRMALLVPVAGEANMSPHLTVFQLLDVSCKDFEGALRRAELCREGRHHICYITRRVLTTGGLFVGILSFFSRGIPSVEDCDPLEPGRDLR